MVDFVMSLVFVPTLLMMLKREPGIAPQERYLLEPMRHQHLGPRVRAHGDVARRAFAHVPADPASLHAEVHPQDPAAFDMHEQMLAPRFDAVDRAAGELRHARSQDWAEHAAATRPAPSRTCRKTG